MTTDAITNLTPGAGVDVAAGRRGRDEASRPAGAARRMCAWCEKPIPAAARRDARCCSTRCRQARHRLTRTVHAGHGGGRARPVVPGRARRLAYADPPYPGNAWLYRGHPDFRGEVDHAALLARLAGYDGWALSTSARALPAVLALCPPGVRVAAWHRGHRPTRSRYPLSAWEPVIYTPLPVVPARIDTRRTDCLTHGVAAMTTLPGRVIGAKPAAFCAWLFALLAATPRDTLEDLFPGSGAVGRAWTAFTRDPSGQAPPDASCRTSRDPSRPPRGDASSQPPPHASRRASTDPSGPAGHDASSPTDTTGGPDASAPTADTTGEPA